jgi:hypothetical protein
MPRHQRLEYLHVKKAKYAHLSVKELAEKARRYAKSAKAPSTMRAYKSDWLQFEKLVPLTSTSVPPRLSRHSGAAYRRYCLESRVTHGKNPLDRAEAIRLHCASKGGSVLVSPSLTEGVDLKDELARYQIVCKVPYPRLDAYTRARSARDRRWYELKTAWALVQMVGRAVRSDTDFAATFVLDSHFEKFASRNERILPAWWRSAIRTSAKAA